MLYEYLNRRERELKSSSDVAAMANHPTVKGNARESFIEKFLKSHLANSVDVDTGLIFDCNSQPGDARNQHDVVIYKRSMPKISFSDTQSGFLAESVVATIEVKSMLTKDELSRASLVASRTKKLTLSPRSGISIGYVPPAILNYVFAFDGPAQMQTVYDWLPDINRQHGIEYPALSLDVNQRLQTPSPALDGVFVLGRGVMQYGNSPCGFFSQDHLASQPNARWFVADMESGSLALLFLLLCAAVDTQQLAPFDVTPYVVKTFKVGRHAVGP